MNFMDLIKKAFSNSWTGGASINPRTGELGAPNRFHGRGTFDDFKMADLFNKDRWAREKIGDPNPKSDRQMYTSYYIPKTEPRWRPEEDVTDTTVIEDGSEKRTISRKFKDPGYPSQRYDREKEGIPNYEPNPGADRNWRASYPKSPWRPGYNPGYPGQQNTPSMSSIQEPSYPSMNANYTLQRSGQENLNNFHPVRKDPGYPSQSYDREQYSMRNPGNPGQQGIPSPLYPPRQSFEGSNPYQPNLGRNPFNDTTLYPERHPDISSDRNPFSKSSLTAGITPEMKKIMIDMMRRSY